MRLSSRNPVDRVREYLLVRDLTALTDAEFLAKFIATREEDAFTALVRRHSPVVLGTARRILPDVSDADDVFQAALRTLARKARKSRCLAAPRHLSRGIAGLKTITAGQGRTAAHSSGRRSARKAQRPRAVLGN